MNTESFRHIIRGAVVVSVLFITAREARAQDSVAVAHDLYASAAYEDALVVLNRLDPSKTQPSDRLAINQYRAFCLVALRRTGEAEQAIEAVLSDQPLYHPADADASPRLMSAFATVRQRVLPNILQQKYSKAKAAFDRQEFGPAAMEFDQVLQALADKDLGDASAHPPLSDLRTLATGFRDLSVRAAVPPPAPAAPVAAAAAPAMPRVPMADPARIYAMGDAEAAPPVIVRQDLPPFPRVGIPAGQGMLEVVINENGGVDSAAMRIPMTPRYDTMVLNATKNWRFKPATVGGTPVKFRKMITISIKNGD
jgi:TonB family protein